ncbi:MAG TPA: TA system VapC family ribonuclease toxin [Casimicrobiaceae bacterium]|nr:TA system VapC family ribonuclease toxin [Casimicrobiaceae bacterium]
MIALDTNVLVYAHRRDSPWHDAARARVAELAEARSAWAIPWPCLHEFVAIVTHPRIFKPATSVAKASDQVNAWLESPSLVLLNEVDGYWPELKDMLIDGRIVGPLVHDARVAALCRLHGVRELWTADRDFGRFPGLTVRNPLVR